MSLLTWKSSKQRVVMVIKDHVLRFLHADGPELEQIKFIGERRLPRGIVQDGKILDALSLSSIVEELVELYDWKRKKLYFCVPDTAVVIRPYTVPADLKEDEIKGYLYMRLEDNLHLPFENPTFDYHIVEEGDTERQLLLFAYPDDQVKAYEYIYKDAKLKPLKADLSSLSLYRLYYELDRAQGDDHLLSIQWYVDACVLTVYHNHRPRFIRHMKSSLDMEQWNFHQESSIYHSVWSGDPEVYEAFIDDQLTEIERIMDFYRYSVTQGEAGITKILLTGDLPNMDVLRSQMQERFQQPVEGIKQEFMTKEEEVIPTAFTDVIGLALKS
ncbi:hypothetical protein N781_10585 [Pontibacillus halophilus JSM 076056 = DSM 19796]|uniref:Tfp pilus assembly protein, ATPase PilM n=1 Tax=Pontibacillus halophilus JSM 076056 = DSM 19796 TaxID=1385510 RepID=A0A0A5GR41_9BACI|nr:pilus assembly protein PilM [Pontibacillus halophilus]KGX93625.1 hypothetical protein N781_10585 [Pontibacillus halophilus JSM 076056 = DSM 19796]